MQVFWLIQAQDALENSLGSANLNADAYQSTVAKLSQGLWDTFSNSDSDPEAIIVVDCLHGYSDDLQKHVLRVEVIRGGVSEARIVKLGPPEDLAKEWNGWHDCARPSNDRGRVFMQLTVGKPAEGDGYESLVYEDAQQTLRAADVISLEQAVRNCCRWGQPSAESLEGVFDQLFAELADRLYTRSAPCALAGELRERVQEVLDKGLPHWQQPGKLPEECRRVSLSLLPADLAEFFDPVDYLPRLFNLGKHLPEVLRGPAHGDLHGRNSLVGVVETKARFPALFDYEDLARDRLPAWDFVKLEMELKVRALQDVFSGDEKRFLKSVHEFERQLAETTEEHNNRTNWPRLAEPSGPSDRLLNILLAIRRQAKRCLETLQGRSRSWLHEYYFLLSVYGVYSGKFSSYRRRDVMAAFLCAGLAASRYAWAKSDAADEVRLARQAARQAIDTGDAKTPPPTGQFSHHGAFAFARQFTRSRQVPFVESAVEMLSELRNRYPYVPDIGQELALAQLELSSLSEDEDLRLQAQTLLHKLEQQTRGDLPMETLCRWGRLWKDNGDAHFDRDPASPLAHDHYQRSLGYYKRAFELEQNYYPGINVATLHLLLGEEIEAITTAQSILDDLDAEPSFKGDERCWILATQAEAHLILSHFEQAADLYRQAVAHPAATQHSKTSMSEQVKRILRTRDCRDLDFATIFRP